MAVFKKILVGDFLLLVSFNKITKAKSLKIFECSPKVGVKQISTDILREIADEVDKKRKINKNQRVVIGVAGAGCIGKTTFIEQLREILGDAEVINLDGYMLERKLAYKIEPGMTGYDPRRNDLKKAQKEISNLVVRGIPFKQRDYDRSTHQRTEPKEVLPKPIIIIDGVHALHDMLLPLVNFGIFLDAPEEVQYQLRLRRERKEFKYDEKKVKKRWKKYYPDYLNHIATQKKYADIVLRVGHDYNLELDTSLKTPKVDKR